MKIRPVGVELFHADGRRGGRTDGRTDRQTDRQDEVNGRFSQFCEKRLKTICQVFVVATLNLLLTYEFQNLTKIAVV